MKVIIKIKLVIILLMMSLSLLYSEDNCNLQSFKIKEDFFNENIVAYYLTAIDINSGTSYISLFQYSIEGNNNCYNSNDSSSVNLFLEFSMDIFSPAIGFNSSQNLFSGKIKLSNISSIITFY